MGDDTSRDTGHPCAGGAAAGHGTDLGLRDRLGLDGAPSGNALRLARRVRSLLFTRLLAPGFRSFGRRTTIEPPLRLDGERAIAIGEQVYIGTGSWLQVLGPTVDGVERIRIGDGSEMVGPVTLSAVERIEIGPRVLVAANVYVSDHSHGRDDPELPILEQGVAQVAPVAIGEGSWLGQNVVVLPGTTLGRGCVVGANSVVSGTFPDGAVIAGAPARIVRRRK